MTNTWANLDHILVLETAIIPGARYEGAIDLSKVFNNGLPPRWTVPWVNGYGIRSILQNHNVNESGSNSWESSHDYYVRRRYEGSDQSEFSIGSSAHHAIILAEKSMALECDTFRLITKITEDGRGIDVSRKFERQTWRDRGNEMAMYVRKYMPPTERNFNTLRIETRLCSSSFHCRPPLSDQNIQAEPLAKVS